MVVQLVTVGRRWAKDYLRRRLDWVVEDRMGEQDYTSNTRCWLVLP